MTCSYWSQEILHIRTIPTIRTTSLLASWTKWSSREVKIKITKRHCEWHRWASVKWNWWNNIGSTKRSWMKHSGWKYNSLTVAVTRGWSIRRQILWRWWRSLGENKKKSNSKDWRICQIKTSWVSSARHILKKVRSQKWYQRRGPGER